MRNAGEGAASIVTMENRRGMLPSSEPLQPRARAPTIPSRCAVWFCARDQSCTRETHGLTRTEQRCVESLFWLRIPIHRSRSPYYNGQTSPDTQPPYMYTDHSCPPAIVLQYFVTQRAPSLTLRGRHGGRLPPTRSCCSSRSCTRCSDGTRSAVKVPDGDAHVAQMRRSLESHPLVVAAARSTPRRSVRAASALIRGCD
mgnify:CR=1 FL=1